MAAPRSSSRGGDVLEQCVQDWEELSEEYLSLEDLHKSYRSKLQEVIGLQKKCISGVKHQRYRLNAIKNTLRQANTDHDGEKETLKGDLDKDIAKRRAQLSQIEDYLPCESGLYLRVILGSVNVSILDKEAKYQYKEQYENFKLIVVSIACVLAVMSLYLTSRLMDLMFMFLIVWYYCTLTIRESILKVNGSKIRGWWRAHHFISTVAGGVLLIWPDGECFQAFRNQLMWFNIYVAFISYLQFTYQRGCLYRLKSLGLRKSDMDITIDGLNSWMWKGLGFLTPFLALGYLWQLYNSYTLYFLSKSPSATWQVPCLSLIFATLGAGNIFTTILTWFSKVREQRRGYFRFRFTRLDKYFWTHKTSAASKIYSIVAEKMNERKNSMVEGIAVKKTE